MTFALRRCFWVVDLGFTAAAAALCSLLAVALVPRPVRIPEIPLAFSGAPSVAKTALDPKAVSQVMGLPLAESLPTSAPSPSPAEPVAPLSVRLLGTTVSNIPELSLATLQDLTSAQAPAVYAIGDAIQGATILDIERLRVTVDNRGRREVIDLEQSVAPAPAPDAAPKAPSAGPVPGISEVGRGEYVVDRKLVETFIADPTRELTKAFFTPAYQGGITRGWKLSRLAPDALLRKLGLAPGDVVRRINGFELTDPTRLLEAFGRLRDASQVELEVERNGAPQRLEYRISG